MKDRRNPLLLPRPDLVDSIFDLIAVAAKKYIDYYNSIPKFQDNRILIYSSIIEKNLKTFIGHFNSIYDNKIPADLDIHKKNAIDSLNRLVVELNRYIIIFDPLNLALSDSSFFTRRVRDITNKTSLMIQNIQTITDTRDDPRGTWDGSYHKLLDEYRTFEDQIQVLSYASNALSRKGEVEKFIEDYDPKLPEKWNMVSRSNNDPSYFILETHFYMFEEDAEALFNIPHKLEVVILPSFEDSVKRSLGSCGFDDRQNTIYMKYHLLPNTLFSRVYGSSATYPEEWYAVALHECVHLWQYLCDPKNAHSFTGLPYPRQDQYRSYKKDAEKALKLEYSINGLNPDLVDFHALDDIEFYTRLLDEIINFIKEFINPNRKIDKEGLCDLDLEVKMDNYIGYTHFFKVLNHFQEDKYNLAVLEFKEAISTRYEQLERDYACKTRDARKVKKEK